MIIREYRIVLPFTCEEYQRGQLYGTAKASLENTGGGEGVEVLKNEPFDGPVRPQLLDNRTQGQFTHKVFHLEQRVPFIVRAIAPKGSLQLTEEAWNAYPYCRTVVTNPSYMKENFFIKIETMHLEDRGTTENAHQLPKELLEKREVVVIDIGSDCDPRDYKPDEDPSLAKNKSQKTGRGPLAGCWQRDCKPVMCAYKLVTVHFKWFGLQTRVEKYLQAFEQRLFTTFHKKVFCWLDDWFEMNMQDIRHLEDKTQQELLVERQHGNQRGMQE